jgi:hypothetical protein
MSGVKILVVTALSLFLWIGGLAWIHSAFVDSGRYELDANGERKSWVETEGFKIVGLTFACAFCWVGSVVILKKIDAGGASPQVIGLGSGITVRCPQCAAVLADSDRFCSSCGGPAQRQG